MEERLYLFEVLVDSIYFDESVPEIPQKKQIVVSVKLGNIVTLEIRSETLGTQSGNKRLIDFKSGRSHLVSLKKDKLLHDLDTQMLEVTVSGRGDVKPIGSSNAPWDDCFKEMVQVPDEEFVTPAFIDDNFCLLENGAIRGNVQLFLRLSCFGKSIQTQFEVLLDGGNKQFLFKTPNMATTFICSKYGAGTSSEYLPIGPLYNSGYMKGEKPTGHISASFTAVMPSSSTIGKRGSMVSVCLFPEYLNIVPAIKDSSLTFDIVSLRARPEEEKFFDFLTGKKFGDLQGSLHSIIVADEEGNERTIFFFDEHKRESTEITKESKSCQCPPTPAYCKHVYAAIEKYEKSHPDLMIYGKRVKYEKILKNKPENLKEKSDSLLRLRGGDDEDEDEPYVHKKKKGCYNPCCRMAFKLREIGKSQVEGIQDEEKDDFCGEFYCPEGTRRNIGLQVVFSEEDIPKLTCVNRYCPAAKMFKKLGLGPLANEKCQGTLYGPVKPPVQYAISQTYGTLDTYGPYGIFSESNTPFMQSEGKYFRSSVLRLRGGGISEVIADYSSRMRGGGTTSNSPIAECQEIIQQLDEILENYKEAMNMEQRREFELEAFMKPSTTPNCGHPRCTYISEPPLKPIHWDCPDPLPVGICKNPKCPYLPEELKRVEKVLGSRKHQNSQMCDNNSGSMVCRPFYPQAQVLNCMQVDEAMTKIASCCSNPNCPLKGLVSSCSNPLCPYAHGASMGEPCSNPSCPFNAPSPPCTNPDCPMKKATACTSPGCPFPKMNLSDACANPDCPMKEKGTPDCSCTNPDCPSKKTEGVCENPECANPDCPFKKGGVPIWLKMNEECKCSNPNCPDHKETCSNPECPFNQDKVEVCANPKCPNKLRESTKKKGICGSPQRSVCEDETCPFHEGAGDDGKGDEKKEQASTTGAGDVAETAKQLEGGPLEYTKGDRSSIYEMTPCVLTTCKYMGGKLICSECAELNQKKKTGPCPKICPGDLVCPLAIDAPKIVEHVPPKRGEIDKRALRKARKAYVYHFGDNYPGFHRGHKECVVNRLCVPAKMGWMWTIHSPIKGLKPRRGWRPGVIAKTVLEAIQAHRKALNMKPLEEIKAKRRRRKFGSVSEADIPRIRPTVQVKKKEGVYYITLNPLKDPNTLVPNENPYMETTPLQFRILKAKDTNDYKSCVCNDKGIVVEPESSSSDSELDIEFTPPAGIIRPEKFGKIRNVVHTDTQYDPDDILPPGQRRGKKGKGKDKKKGKKKK